LLLILPTGSQSWKKEDFEWLDQKQEGVTYQIKIRIGLFLQLMSRKWLRKKSYAALACRLYFISLQDEDLLPRSG